MGDLRIENLAVISCLLFSPLNSSALLLRVMNTAGSLEHSTNIFHLKELHNVLISWFSFPPHRWHAVRLNLKEQQRGNSCVFSSVKSLLTSDIHMQLWLQRAVTGQMNMLTFLCRLADCTAAYNRLCVLRVYFHRAALALANSD